MHYCEHGTESGQRCSLCENGTPAYRNNARVPMKPYREPCECADPGCPCKGRCARGAVTRLHRIDMDDASGIAFCRRCADDAAACGMFSEDAPADSDVAADPRV